MPIPVYPDLPFSRQPWATLSLILIMGLVYFWSVNNEWENDSLARSYAAASMQELEARFGVLQQLDDSDLQGLERWIASMANLRHARPYEDTLTDDDINTAEDYIRGFPGYQQWADQRREGFWHEVDTAINESMEAIKVEGNFSFYGAFIEHTSHFNPLRWVSSTLIHADFWHFFWNAVFFFSFGAIAEILINSTRRYLLILIEIALVVGLSDWATSLGADGYYTLGMSGVVMGAIGISAYLAPRARVRSFQMFGWFYGRLFSIPIWILATIFIGGDLYSWLCSDVTYGVNVFAHIVGGSSGYLLAALTLKDRKEDIEYELDNAIEQRRAQRADRLGLISSATTEMLHDTGDRLQKEDTRKFERHMDQIYRYVEKHEYSLGTVELVDTVDTYGRLSLERMEGILERMKQWGPNPVSLNMCRLVINRAIAMSRFDIAEDALLWAQTVTPIFVLADPVNVPYLATYLVEQQRYEAASLLIRDFEQRYAGFGDLAAINRVEKELSLLPDSLK